MLLDWENLPEEIKFDCVKRYYEILRKKKIQLFIKRIGDVIFSILLIILFLPIFITISILIRLDSPGEIFYRQKRVTQYGKIFYIFKFRTMIVNADCLGSHVTGDNDARITDIGKVLRKYRLDELPQLINILNGTMTFVGTRPEAVRYTEMYTNEMKATLLLPAGVTSKASILFKDEASMLKNVEDIDKAYVENVLPLKMKINLEAIEGFSLIEDIKIIMLTIFKVLK